MFDDGDMPSMGLGEGAGASVAIAVVIWGVAKIKTIFEAAKNIIEIVTTTVKFLVKIVTFVNEWEKRAALLAEHEQKLCYLGEALGIDYEETWHDEVTHAELTAEEVALVKTFRMSRGQEVR